MSTRILIVDDQELVRAGFSAIIESQADLEVVGEAGDGAAAVERSRELSPDVVLMDIRMPHQDGVEATRRIMRLSAPPRVLVLTTFDLDEYVYDALKAGASGFLLKNVPRDQLLAGIRTVAAGEALLAPAITRRLIEDFVRRPAPGAANPTELAELSPRELEVYRLLARGLSNNEIAASLYLSEATIKTHVASILSKLELRDRAQLIVLAYETGLVQPGPDPTSTG